MTLQRLQIEDERITVERKGKLEEITALPIGNPCIIRSNHYHVYGHNVKFTEKEVPMKDLFEEIGKVATEKFQKANAFVASMDHTTRIGDSYFYSNFAVQFYRISEVKNDSKRI